MKRVYYYLTTSLLLLLLIFITITLSSKNDIVDISREHYYENFAQKESSLNSFLQTYITSLKALHLSDELYDYVVKNKGKEELQKLFLHNKKSFPDLFQIRYLDKNGMEKIRIDGDPIATFKDEAKSFIVDDEKLQNKSEKDYFKKFIALKPFEIGFSDINLNKDFGKVTLPKTPTLRIAMNVYGNNKDAQGVLIYNISLRKFFDELSKSTLYKIFLVDKDGNFILHSDSKHGLIGDYETYKLKDELPDNYMNVINNNEFTNKKIYSKIMQTIENEQKIRMVLKTKYSSFSELATFVKNNFLLVIFLLFSMIMPLIIYVTLLRKRTRRIVEKV